VIGVITPYIGPDKAVLAVERNLARCGATKESFDNKHFGTIVNYVVGASYVWLDQDKDKEKKAELSAKLRALA